MKKWVVVLILISLCASLGLWGTWDGWQKEAKLRLQAEAQIETYRMALDRTKIELSEKQTKFNNLEAEFGDFKLEAADNLRELESTKSQFKNAVDHVLLVGTELQIVRLELVSQKIYYDNELLEEAKLARESGYREAMAAIEIRRDPTYAEAINLAKGIDYRPAAIQKARGEKGFVCLDFAEVLDSVAEKAGMRCGMAFLVFSYDGELKRGHSINCFDTTDRGRIYFDPVCRAEVTDSVKEGHLYLSGEKIQEIIFFW